MILLENPVINSFFLLNVSLGHKNNSHHQNLLDYRLLLYNTHDIIFYENLTLLVNHKMAKLPPWCVIMLNVFVLLAVINFHLDFESFCFLRVFQTL